MAEGLVEDLAAQIANGQAVVVAGAGVAAGASGRRPEASWVGLLEAGITYCERNLAGLPATWANIQRQLLGLGDLTSMLGVAEDLTRRLGGRDAGEYRGFLLATVGALPLVDDSVPKALARWRSPIATTNYDGLIEKATGWQWATWKDTARLLRAMRSSEELVAHLHGYWDEPSSVVLGIASYGDVLAHPGTQALQQALTGLRSLVFVGVGAGADDPNWLALRQFAAKAYGGSEVRHYRLCLAGEVAALVEQHRDDPIVPVAYGDSHGDLAGFLETLAPGQPPVEIPVTHARLPAPRDTVGREAEVAEMVENVLARRPTVVLGGPGIGKTNLTLATAHHPAVAAEFADRRWFVRCETATNVIGVGTALATELGLPPSPDPIPAVLARIAETPGLVVLDNAETPWEGDTLATEDFFAAVAATEGVALVASVRGNERPAGAWSEVRLSPLGVDAAHELFLDIAGPRFEDPELDALLDELGGLALAVELLAHVATGEPDTASLVARWRQERTALLARGAGDNKQLSAAVSVETSWNSPQLTDDGRRVLALLGYLPDGIAYDDLETLLPGAGLAGANVLQRRALAFDENRRLRTQPPIRHHVAAAHPPTDEDRERADLHYLSLIEVEGAHVGGPGGAEAARRLAGDAANVTAALIGTLPTSPGHALDAAAAYFRYAMRSGMDISAVLEAADEVMEADPNDAWAPVHEAVADLAVARSDHATALARYEIARAAYHRLGNTLGLANATIGLAGVALERSLHELAQELLEDAREWYRALDDSVGEANSVFSLGIIAYLQGDYTTARRCFEDALDAFREADEVVGAANCISCLGDIEHAQDMHGGAKALYEEALALYRQAGVVLGEANCIYGMGDRRAGPRRARSRRESHRGRSRAVPASAGAPRPSELHRRPRTDRVRAGARGRRS